jgi:CTP synthase (UTP-ammonia lyase)
VTMAVLRVGLIGDHDPAVTAHRAIPIALARAGEALGVGVELRWMHTSTIIDDALADCDALWCVPASPYASTDGALRGIRFAREHAIPFLGTCGGFQHAILEYARNVWGMHDAAHAEMDPEASNPVIVPLACSLVEARDRVRFVPGTRLAEIYGTPDAHEGYHCRYGLNATMRARLDSGPLQPSAFDDVGDVRAIELVGHPFFVATLFQPERRALADAPNPLVNAFVQAVFARTEVA